MIQDICEIYHQSSLLFHFSYFRNTRNTRVIDAKRFETNKQQQTENSLIPSSRIIKRAT